LALGPFSGLLLLVVSVDDLAGHRALHLCIDMQRMFAEETPWHARWLTGVLPAVEAIVERCPERTIFTRFLPPRSPADSRGAWQSYYEKWSVMTGEHLPPEMTGLVPQLARFTPPAMIIDKAVYSPWFRPDLINAVRKAGADTLIISGGETDVCVAAAVMGAIDHGLRAILPTDAIYGSADETHDAMLRVFRSRFALQLTTCTTQELLDAWRPTP
jgi:nicotinamidase-related amidase